MTTNAERFAFDSAIEVSNNGQTILIADDDALSRRLLARTLSNAGFSCAETADGIEALKAVHSTTPSLLLLDYDMPRLNGADVLKKLRADTDPKIAQLPAIMLTGHGGEESEVRCLEAGADDFVTKPINQAVLRARIETQLRLRSMREQLQQQNMELEAWRQNLERDLAAARLTQQSLIPQKSPNLPGYDVAAAYRPVIQVGGDIYGWLRMGDGRMLFWIADATGHGASAALLTTLAKLLFQHGATEHAGPADVMRAVNSDFRTIFGARSFMTAMCVALEPESGQATVVGAGHPPLLVGRRNAKVEAIASCCPPLGLLEDSKFTAETITLAAGDAFLLYTDGIHGARQDLNLREASARLARILQPPASTAQELVNRVLEQTNANDGSAPDDVAVVAVQRQS